jgi:hypothetical protein
MRTTFHIHGKYVQREYWIVAIDLCVVLSCVYVTYNFIYESPCFILKSFVWDKSLIEVAALRRFHWMFLNSQIQLLRA